MLGRKEVLDYLGELCFHIRLHNCAPIGSRAGGKERMFAYS